MSAPPAPAGAPPAVLSLLADGALRLEAEPALLPLLRRWLPLLPYDSTPSAAHGAVIRLVSGDPAGIPVLPAAPVLRLGSADVWVAAAAGRAVFRCTAGSAGEADLARGVVHLHPAAFGEETREAVAWDVYNMCTLSCAMLLARMHRSLAHAAAVVAPDGGAWLLAGDTHAGKSTTSVNLIEAGWRFVSDDHVVLFRGGDGRIRVEGWPRYFHLDEGWEDGSPLHRRGEIDPHERWPGRWLRTAPLAGLLFPRVEADRPTELAPMAGTEALAGLMRQSPWLLADRACAAEVLSFLRAACEHPAYALRLGLDTYRDTARLLEVLRPLGG
ncbi:MAG TPA: hypothetical protein VF771_12380 [Longimicrobiaceae bacterium]